MAREFKMDAKPFPSESRLAVFTLCPAIMVFDKDEKFVGTIKGKAKMRELARAILQAIGDEPPTRGTHARKETRQTARAQS